MLPVSDIIAMKSHSSLKYIDSSVMQALENMHTRLSVLEDRYLAVQNDSNPVSEAAPSAAQLERILNVLKCVDDKLWTNPQKTAFNMTYNIKHLSEMYRDWDADELIRRGFFSDGIGKSISVDMWKREFLRVSLEKFESRRGRTDFAFYAGSIAREIFSRALRMAFPDNDLGNLQRDLRTD